MKSIRFHVGGPSFHPTAQQAELVRQWLGSGFDCQICDGVEAFDDISSVDLLVIMGLHWPGMSEPWAGGLIYRLPNETQKQNKETINYFIIAEQIWDILTEQFPDIAEALKKDM